MNSGSLPQNKVLFGLDLLVKFSFLHGNTCRQSKTFFGNRGYYFEEEFEVSGLPPITGNESCRRTAVANLSRPATAANFGVLPRAELSPTNSASFGSFPQARPRR